MPWRARFLAGLRMTRLASGLASAGTPHRVSGLTITPGRATATVSSPPHRESHVRIAIQVVSPAGWARVRHAADDGGSSPDDLWRTASGADDFFRALGLPLFPALPEDVDAECTCPAGRHCAHVAAALRHIAAALEEDHSIILRWRGCPEEWLPDGHCQPPGIEEGPAFLTSCAPSSAEPLSECVERYWIEPPTTDHVSPVRHCVTAPHRLRPPEIAVRNRNLASVLDPLYQVFTEQG
jgi:hypothetical protein